MNENRVMLADSYKFSHSSQYPDNMVSQYNYMESRGGVYPATKFFGLQYYIKKYLWDPFTIEEVVEAQSYAKLHGVPFDIEGWNYIVNELNGLLPVRIKAVPEGSLIPTGNVLMTIESTDTNVPWIAGWLETLLMKIWYPTTVATKSHYVKQMLLNYGSEDWANFAYHNFGDRGSTSVEAAAIGGMAHLSAGFYGTDNFNSLFYASEYYEAEIAGFSVFATEHSSTTSHGRNGEEHFVLRALEDNPDAPIMSFVADSYDVYAFTEMCTAKDSTIREIVESRDHQTFVLRPDSGDPIEVLRKMTSIMYHQNKVDHIIDANGKCVFKDFKILWGDGVTPEQIELILSDVVSRGYAAENFVFGSGGDLMQNITRDTQKFAIKCSSITVDDNFDEPLSDFPPTRKYRDIDVFKDPITDPGKTSKKGKVTTYYNPTTQTYFVDKVNTEFENATEVLQTVYLNGELTHNSTLDEIRSTV